MSIAPRDRDRPSEAVAGLLAAAAIFAALIGVAYRPVRIAPFAIGLALVASLMAGGGRHGRLAAYAVAITGVAFVAGMMVAVLTENPLW